MSVPIGVVSPFALEYTLGTGVQVETLMGVAA